MTNIFRPDPLAPVNAYKTYGLLRPASTHWRRATCEEIGCEAFQHGWLTTVEPGSEQADYIRRHSGRSFEEIAPGQFKFKAGQTCFGAASHKLPIEREPIYIVRDGDHRGNPTGWRREHKNGVEWVEDFGEHQDFLSSRINRG